MRKAVAAALLVLTWVTTAFQSCIFQTDPVRPNSPPVIRDSSPEDLVLYMEAPVDSILFSMTASTVKLSCGRAGTRCSCSGSRDCSCSGSFGDKVTIYEQHDSASVVNAYDLMYPRL